MTVESELELVNNKNKVWVFICIALISFTIPVSIHLISKANNKQKKSDVPVSRLNRENVETLMPSSIESDAIIYTIIHEADELKKLIEELKNSASINSYESKLKTEVDELKKIIEEIKTSTYINAYDAQLKAEPEVEVLTGENNNVKLNEAELPTTWLNSPVTQAWTFDAKKQVWMTALPYKDSMRSSPSIIIGMREDGIIVWKKITKEIY